MRLLRIAGSLVGAFIAFLGLLWFLQGVAIIEMRPILCFTNCEPIMGGSQVWAAVGVIALIIGIVIVFVSLRYSGS